MATVAAGEPKKSVFMPAEARESRSTLWAQTEERASRHHKKYSQACHSNTESFRTAADSKFPTDETESRPKSSFRIPSCSS